MKTLFLCLSLLTSASAFADCPNFSGKFKTDAGDEFYQVSQSGCAKISIQQRFKEELSPPPILWKFVIDGQRRPAGDDMGAFWAAYWTNEGLALEPWEFQSAGRMVGYREFWTLKSDARGTFILQQIINPVTGVVDSATEFRKY